MKTLIIVNSSKLAIVDDEDYERLSKFNWRCSGTSIQRFVRSGYRLQCISFASEVMNRPNTMYDHRDRDGFNNQKSNLRECTYSQNNINVTKQSYTSSRYKGVFRSKKRSRWVAQISFNGVHKTLGYFRNEVDAALAYNKAALEKFGEFAVLNEIPQEVRINN